MSKWKVAIHWYASGTICLLCLGTTSNATADDALTHTAARIRWQATLRMAPTKIDIEDQLKRYTSGLRQQGLPDWAIQENATVQRKALEALANGIQQTVEYDTVCKNGQFAEDEKGSFIAQNLNYNRTVVYNGTDTYLINDNGIDRSKAPHMAQGSNRAEIAGGRDPDLLRCGWGQWVYLRGQSAEALIQNAVARRLAGTTQTEIVGDVRSMTPFEKADAPFRIRMIRDSRYGNQVTDIEVSTVTPSAAVVRRVRATSFRRVGEGGWFPWTVEEESLIARGEEKGKVVQVRVFRVLDASFGPDANVGDIMPAVLSHLKVADRRFPNQTIGYDVSARWLTRQEAEAIYRRHLALDRAAANGQRTSRLPLYLMGGSLVLLFLGTVAGIARRRGTDQPAG